VRPAGKRGQEKDLQLLRVDGFARPDASINLLISGLARV
jgi:hypothetical protein